MKAKSRIEILMTPDGSYRATCPEFGLEATGATMAEAEAGVLRLLDERTQQLGTIQNPRAIESERDTRLEFED
jgi:hypothetical protein